MEFGLHGFTLDHSLFFLQDIEEAIVTLIHGAVWEEALRLVSY